MLAVMTGVREVKCSIVIIVQEWSNEKSKKSSMTQAEYICCMQETRLCGGRTVEATARESVTEACSARPRSRTGKVCDYVTEYYFPMAVEGIERTCLLAKSRFDLII